jgi:hypothetical protein
MVTFVIAFAVLARILFGMWRDSQLPPAIQLRLPEFDEALEIHVEPKTALDRVVNVFMFCVLELPVFLGVIALFHSDLWELLLVM